MKIHEYQAKAILAQYGVPVPRGEMATTAAEAGAIARRLGGAVSVVKAQIHAGGRGKGGGVKVVKSAEEAERVAGELLGMQLVTHQTGPGGTERLARAGRGRSADRARALFRHAHRSLVTQPRGHGQLGGWRRHRGSGGEDAASHHQGSVDPGGRAHAVPGAQDRVRHRSRGPADSAGRQAAHRALSGVHRQRRVAHRDQPADRHR